MLHARFLRGGARVTLMPCELIANNGSVLREAVTGLARSWEMDGAFLVWLKSSCVWVNSLVDRIVSQALEPAGAVAEPYGLWAIEEQPGMVVMDIVYKPIETALVRKAEAQGAKVVHGGRMLLHQAARQFELYTGERAPLEAMDKALQEQIKLLA